MKKVLIWNEEYEGRRIGQIERIEEASQIDKWSHHLKSKMISLPLNEPINDIEIMPEIISANPSSFLKLIITEAKDEKWVKEGEDDQSTQPMIPERWSDGITTVYSEDEVPVVDGEPDVDFHHFQATEDNSWTYVPAVEYSWEIVDDEEAIQADAQKKAIRAAVTNAISFGQKLLVDFASENVEMGITQDNMTKTVRQAMSEVASAIQSGSLYDAIDEIDEIPAEAKDGKYITDERLAVYKQKILDYLA